MPRAVRWPPGLAGVKGPRLAAYDLPRRASCGRSRPSCARVEVGSDHRIRRRRALVARDSGRAPSAGATPSPGRAPVGYPPTRRGSRPRSGRLHGGTGACRARRAHGLDALGRRWRRQRGAPRLPADWWRRCSRSTSLLARGGHPLAGAVQRGGGHPCARCPRLLLPARAACSGCRP
jgi:hypothetical protein